MCKFDLNDFLDTLKRLLKSFALGLLRVAVFHLH